VAAAGVTLALHWPLGDGAQVGYVLPVTRVETIMIKNGLYSLNAISRDGVAEDVGGVPILRDSQLHGGDAYSTTQGATSALQETGSEK
jgi:hypothetical protein